MVNNIIDNYTRFFEDQVTEQKREYQRLVGTPMKQLFYDDHINLGTVHGIIDGLGHVILKIRKGQTPRLKSQKSFTLLNKKGREALGTKPSEINISLKEFNEHSDWHIGLSDIYPLYFLKDNDPYYDYIGCSSVRIKMFTQIKMLLAKGIHPSVLLFDPFPPTAYLENMAYYTSVSEDNRDLLLKPNISYDEWHPEELSFNPNDNNAIANKVEETLEKNNICILQGPPGTGKTYTVAHIIADYLKEGKTACITTMANKGLMELVKNDSLAEFVRDSRVMKTHLSVDESKEVPGLLDANTDLIAAQGQLLCATNYVLSGLFSKNNEKPRPHYDLIVIEEASQAFLSTIAAFKTLGEKCLIVGDPMQLPPIVKNLDTKIEYKIWHAEKQCNGLLDYALGTNIKSYRIVTTHRLTPKSAELTSLFYGSSFRSVRKEFIDFSKIDLPIFPSEGGVIYKQLHGHGDQRYSEEAICLIGKIISKMEEFYPNNKVRRTELAIISPFRDTVKILQRNFQTEGRKIDLTVETIDRIQGMTVDYTILYIPQTEVKFALEERRFNVATSRSRSTTLILSDVPLEKMSSLHGKVKVFLYKVMGLSSSTQESTFRTQQTDDIHKEHLAKLGVSMVGKIDLSKFEKPKKELKKDKENIYVIDTNVFVNCPDIISKIDKKYKVVLSAKVIDELDHLKIKLNADGVRNVQKALKNINQEIDKRDIKMELTDLSLLPQDFDRRSPDNNILTVLLKYKNENPILLTSDNGLQIKAKGLGLTVISLKDYQKERRT